MLENSNELYACTMLTMGTCDIINMYCEHTHTHNDVKQLLHTKSLHGIPVSQVGSGKSTESYSMNNRQEMLTEKQLHCIFSISASVIAVLNQPKANCT